MPNAFLQTLCLLADHCPDLSLQLRGVRVKGYTVQPASSLSNIHKPRSRPIRACPNLFDLAALLRPLDQLAINSCRGIVQETEEFPIRRNQPRMLVPCAKEQEISCRSFSGFHKLRMINQVPNALRREKTVRANAIDVLLGLTPGLLCVWRLCLKRDFGLAEFESRDPPNKLRDLFPKEKQHPHKNRLPNQRGNKPEPRRHIRQHHTKLQ